MESQAFAPLITSFFMKKEMAAIAICISARIPAPGFPARNAIRHKSVNSRTETARIFS